MPENKVDPFAIRIKTRAQKEYWVLFGIMVANKSAEQTYKKLNALLSEIERLPIHCGGGKTPFQLIEVARRFGKLRPLLKKHRTGQYTRIYKAFKSVLYAVDVDKMTVSLLENVYGIGPKTARMIMLYTQPDATCVPLDTHVLKFLAKEYPKKKVPKVTPSAGKTYTELEALFQQAAEKRGKSVRQLDTEVWTSYAKGAKGEGLST